MNASDPPKRWWWPAAKYVIDGGLVLIVLGIMVTRGWREALSSPWTAVLIAAIIHEVWLDPFLKRHVEPQSDGKK